MNFSDNVTLHLVILLKYELKFSPYSREDAMSIKNIIIHKPIPQTQKSERLVYV